MGTYEISKILLLHSEINVVDTNWLNNYQYQRWSHTRRRYSRNNYQKATQGDPDAQYFLGKKYYFRVGVEQGL